MAFNPARWLPSAAYRKAGIIIASTTLHGAVPATATNYTTFFIAPYKCVVLKVDAVWGTASTAGTVNVEKLVDGQAQDGGVDLLSAAINTALVANTLVAGTLIGGANASLYTESYLTKPVKWRNINWVAKELLLTAEYIVMLKPQQ